VTVYFHMTNGLRGCYIADASYVCKVESFREFCREIKEEINWLSSFGENPWQSTAQMQFAWKHLQGKDWHEVCVATDKINRAYGLCVSPATEAEYRESQGDSNDGETELLEDSENG